MTVITWSTFGEHENSSLLKNFVGTSWKSILKLGNLRIFSRVSQKFAIATEDGMVRETYINFQWLLLILVGKICHPMQEHFLWPLLKRKALVATKYFRSFNLIWITKSDFLLFSNAMVSCNVSCWAQLVSVFLRDVEFSQMVIYRLFC